MKRLCANHTMTQAGQCRRGLLACCAVAQIPCCLVPDWRASRVGDDPPHGAEADGRALKSADDGRLAAERKTARLEAQMQDLCTVAAAADAARVKVSTRLSACACQRQPADCYVQVSNAGFG